MYPEDLKYTAEHEWVRSPGESEGSVRIGITHFAQDALGDIVYVSLPEVGETVSVGEACGELESTKSVSDVYAPVAGEVSARNTSLDATPELGTNGRMPCGACRKVRAELMGLDGEVLEDGVRAYRVSELLPDSFTL